MKMKGSVDIEENLREAACFGNEEDVAELIKNGINVNSQNKMNGWTALHWAAARNNKHIVRLLLQNGANHRIQNNKGETPASVTENSEIREMLGNLVVIPNTRAKLPITPSYLKYPSMPKCQTCQNDLSVSSFNKLSSSCNYDKIESKQMSDKLVLKVRVANSQEPDFIEIELDQSELTIGQLKNACYDELELKDVEITKIRKLPNTIIRKDKDVHRLTDYQEIELILQQRMPFLGDL